ncbi:MAG: flippase [Sphaerochaeta sp.]|jgi:O-antigen/teichoic acid export membrane protein|nr:flippase [Sphaerochaeta sp.]
MQSIKKNYAYNLFYQLLTAFIPLVTAPYLSRVLEPEGIGAFSYTSSVVTYFTLFAALGTANFGQREISYCQQDRERRTVVFWETKILGIVSMLVCLAVYLVFAFHSQAYRVLYLILSLNIISVGLDVTWLFQGMEEFGKIVFRNTVVKILNVVFIFACIHQKEDLTLYVLGMAGFSLVGQVAMWFGIPRYVGLPDGKKLHPFRNLRTVLSLFAPTIAISIYTVLDKTMLGVLTRSVAENGVYEQATKISHFGLMFVTSLGTVMVPRIGAYVAAKEKEQIHHAMYRSYQFAWFLGIPISFGLSGIAGNLVPWFFGQGYDKVISLLQTLCWVNVAVGISNVTGIQYLVPTKRQNLLTLTVTIGAVVNFFCNALLIPRWYALGAAIGSVIAEVCVTVSQLVCVRKELSIKEILRSSVRYWIAGIVMAVVLWWENKVFTPSLIHTLIMIISGMVVYGLLMIIMQDTFVWQGIGVIKKKLSQR